MFWGSSKNKTQLQQYFRKLVMENYKGEKAVYVGGIQDNNSVLCEMLLRSESSIIEGLSTHMHEEADDRIMLHINHGVQSMITSIIVASADTDVFVNLLYHYQDP